MNMNRKPTMQAFLSVVMFGTALVVRLLSTIVARVLHLVWLASLDRSFLGSCLSIAVGVAVALSVGVNLDPAKAKPAVRFLLLPSTKRSVGARASNNMVISPTMERVGHAPQVLLFVAVVVLGVAFIAQLVTRRLTPGSTILDVLLLVALVVVGVVPKLLRLAGRHRGG
jgi:hypothetical protein